MSPDEMAALHAACFDTPRPWSAPEFASLLEMSGVFLCLSDAGFALGRAIADEAELLTIAVSPHARRQGAGRSLLSAFDAEAAKNGANTVFLEVSAENTAAIALYVADGYVRSGLRKGYYKTPEGGRIDAFLFQKPIE